jgi:two-component system, chemotaxis family, response regulator Rcp1
MPETTRGPEPAPAVEILMAEDNPGDVRLTRESLKDASRPCNLSAVADGTEALAFLRREGVYADAPRPSLVLLDLNMPKLDGHELLAEMKSDPDLRRIPVVVFTSSAEARDVFEAYDRHANAYVIKPVRLEDFSEVVKSFEDFWLTTAVLPPT